jgi:excisionase family DNA binding protein
VKRPIEGPVPVRARMLNVKQAAEYLGATVWFVRTECWADRLKSVRFGNRQLIDVVELDKYIERAKAAA